MVSNLDSITDTAFRLIDEHMGRMIPTELERYLRTTGHLTRIEARTTIRTLVQQGLLAYRWELGHAFIERSFHHPVRISEHIVLCPAGFPITRKPGEAVIVMEKGSAFGTGRHPTTRLCLGAIDHLITHAQPWPDLADTSVLDVGTGSGVLLLGALLLGIAKGVGIDRDPCAVYEANQNAELNVLSSRAQILDTPMNQIVGRFDLVCANLRFPSLIGFSELFCERLKPPGGVVLSGLKAEEAPEVTAAYESLGMTCIRQDVRNGWAALSFVK